MEVDLKQKGTPLHDATVVGDTVGDPFKDTSSVALNPIIKFTTLFGLLAVELAVRLTSGTRVHDGHILAARVLLSFPSFRMAVVLRNANRNGERQRKQPRLPLKRAIIKKPAGNRRAFFSLLKS